MTSLAAASDGGSSRSSASSSQGHLPVTLTVDELLHLAGHGDRDAFASLYDRTAPQMLGLVGQYLPDRDQMHAVTKASYLELWEHATRFDSSKGKALTWMLTIAQRRSFEEAGAAEGLASSA